MCTMRSLTASCKDVGVIPVEPLTVSVNSQRLEEKNDGGGGGAEMLRCLLLSWLLWFLLWAFDDFSSFV